MLTIRSVKPSQIGPFALSLRASAQSSIRAPRMAAIPPARRFNLAHTYRSSLVSAAYEDDGGKSSQQRAQSRQITDSGS
jgi:hypothetical protein